jgi:putative transposase
MYPSDLKDEEWKLIEHHFLSTERRGNSHKHDKKTIVNAILCVAEGGIKWRMMPNDFPPWQTVYDHFSKWNKSGVWESALHEVNRIFREKKSVSKIQATEL